MTHAEIREAIAADPSLQALVRADTQAVADALSIGRIKFIPTEIGKGTVIDVLTLDRANPVLDEIESNTRFRHVKGMLEEGKLRLDWQSVQSELANLVVAGLVTEDEMAALLARAQVPDTVTVQEVLAAMEGI